MAVIVSGACVKPPAPARAEPGALRLPEGFGGDLVWTGTDTDGRHIFRLDKRGLAKLTDGPMEDVYPRLSPDGRLVLFSRARRSGASEGPPPHDDMNWISGEYTHARIPRPSLDWDVYSVPTDGSAPPKLVAERGLWASWAERGRVVFVRDSAIIVRQGDDETTLLEGDRFPTLFENADFLQPTLNGPLLIFGMTMWRRHVGVWDLRRKKWTPIGGGQQIAWSPRGGSVTWLDRRGVGGTAIVKTEIDDDSGDVGPTSTVLDLPLPDSTEAFPKLSNDETWLAFSARRTDPIQRMAGGPPNGVDRTFYDAGPPPQGPLHVYLWRVGADARAAVRITNDAESASWPDAFLPAREAAPRDADAAEASP
jgi:hypothetical protein